MLQTLREKPIIKKVVLSAVLVVMVLGIGVGVTSVIGDLLGARGSSRTPTVAWAMSVGPDVVTQAAFQSELRNVERSLQREAGAGPEMLARARFEVGQQMLRRLLEVQEARKAGLTATDQEVSDRIVSSPEFQRDGAFIGAEEYRVRLQNSDFDVANYEHRIHDSILMEKWENMVRGGAIITDHELDEELARRYQRVRYDFVLLDSAKYAASSVPTEAEVKTFYDAHPERFQRGEGRRARYIMLEANPTDAQIPAPSEDELRKAYESAKDRYTAGSFELAREEVRRQVLFQKAQVETDRRASVFKVTVTDPAAFDAAASKAGLPVQDTGLVRRDPQSLVRFGPDFQQALFQAPKGVVGGPARTLKGTAVFVVTETQPPGRATIEESRGDIVKELSQQKGRQGALEAARRAVASAGGDIARVAKDLGASVQNGPLVSKGEPVPGIGSDAAVESAAFGSEPGNIPAPVMTAGGSVVILKMLEKKTPDTATLSASREAIRSELRSNREQALVLSILESASKRTEVKTNEEFFKQLGS